MHLTSLPWRSLVLSEDRVQVRPTLTDDSASLELGRQAGRKGEEASRKGKREKGKGKREKRKAKSESESHTKHGDDEAVWQEIPRLSGQGRLEERERRQLVPRKVWRCRRCLLLAKKRTSLELWL